jgi:hypothetical protein
MAMARARVRVLGVSRIRRRGFVDARTQTGSSSQALVVASRRFWRLDGSRVRRSLGFLSSSLIQVPESIISIDLTLTQTPNPPPSPSPNSTPLSLYP